MGAGEGAVLFRFDDEAAAGVGLLGADLVADAGTISVFELMLLAAASIANRSCRAGSYFTRLRTRLPRSATGGAAIAAGAASDSDVAFRGRFFVEGTGATGGVGKGYNLT